MFKKKKTEPEKTEEIKDDVVVEDNGPKHDDDFGIDEEETINEEE